MTLKESPKSYLLVGDCLDILPKLDRSGVHLVVTDPPYHLDGFDAEWKKGGKDTQVRRASPKGWDVSGVSGLAMKFDPRQSRELQAFMEGVGQLLLNVLVPGGFAIVFSQPRLAHRTAAGLEDAGFEIRDQYVWHFTRKSAFKAFSMRHFVDRMKDLDDDEKVDMKERLGDRRTPQLKSQFESIVLAQKPKEGTFIENFLRHGTGLIDPEASLDGNRPSTVMVVEKEPRVRENGHPTIKPVQLLEHLIRLFSEPGQMVLDPFVGSGSTAVAATGVGRSCIGIDVNPAYIKIANGRLKDAELKALRT